MHSLLQWLLRGGGFYIGEIFHDAARRNPNTEVVLDRPLQWAPDRGLRFTVSELADQIDDLAARLWAVGVRPSERVAIYKSDNFDIALLACAAGRIGAVPAMLSPALDGEVVLTLLRRLERPWLITDGDKLDTSLAEFPVVAATQAVLLSAGMERAGTTSLAAYPRVPRREPVFLHPRQPSMITHSSGTTGVPKLTVHCPETGWHRLIPQKMIAWPIRGRETAALCITFVHSRFYQGLAMFLSLGNPLVIAVDSNPEHIGPLFARTRPGYVETHPNTFIDWEKLADAPGDPLSSVRYFGATFDAMHPRTIRCMLGASKRPRPLFLQAYGQSEIGPMTVRWYSRRSADQADARCVGFPLPGFISMRAVGPDGRRLKAGQAGHLEVRSRTRILTYLGENERYASQVHDGWWRVGDMGYRDRWGLLHLLDREVDLIESIDSTLAIEDLVMTRLEELREVVIVRGANGEPVPVVCTYDEKRLDVKRWEQATRDLPPMAPVHQLPFEDLPRTSTRKIQRPKLVRLVQTGHVRPV
jgi:long-chain acyl-CoA synthetase